MFKGLFEFVNRNIINYCFDIKINNDYDKENESIIDKYNLKKSNLKKYSNLSNHDYLINEFKNKEEYDNITKNSISNNDNDENNRKLSISNNDNDENNRKLSISSNDENNRKLSISSNDENNRKLSISSNLEIDYDILSDID